MRTHCLAIRATLLTVMAVAATTAAPGRAADSGVAFYEKRVRPILVEHCYGCHSAKAKKLKGGLRLDGKGALLAGGDSGPVVVSGEPDQSLLVDAVSYSGNSTGMPPKGKLPDRVIADLRKWVAIGAPLPDEGPSRPRPQRSVDIEAGRKFWSFQPVRVRPFPSVADEDWGQRKIDWFVLRKLERHRLRPAPAADRRSLIRRVSLDLIGLPPSPREINAFLSDDSPHAYPRLVERLLASPHYGERWGRHWLDVARYAEDNPTSEATCKPPPYPWPYRDWVIQALNDDLPYDEFIRRQLAADLMEGLPPGELAATGFLGLSPVYHKEPKLSAEVISVIVADEWDERLDTVTRGLLGLTVACARCHDHKFDPIRVQDYYALAGIMASTRLVERPLVETSLSDAEALTNTRETIVDYQLRVNYAKKMRQAAEIENRATGPYVKLASKYQSVLEGLKTRELFQGPIANVVCDAGVWVNGDDPDWTVMEFRPGHPRDLPIFIRGNPNNPGETVRRRFIEVLCQGKPKPFQHGSGRLELADSIVSDAASLAARVIVNRVWGWHFGQPLVTTTSNFGALGERPSHPELLDDLAARFIRQGWSLKWLHREIVLSATYRQASVRRDDQIAHRIDPANRLLWRMNRRRLEPEAWRDAVLSVCRRLDTRMFGQSQSLDQSSNHRRTVYGTLSRQNPAAVLQLFDFPDAKRHADRRFLTTTPLQQLFLLNGPFLQENAATVSRAWFSGDQPEPRDTVRRLFRTILLRECTVEEVTNALRLVEPSSKDPNRWRVLAHALLASNEFLFVD